MSESTDQLAAEQHRTRVAAMLALASLEGFGRRRLLAAIASDPVALWERCAAGYDIDGRAGQGPASSWRTAAARIDPLELWHRHRDAGVLVTLLGDEGHVECVPDDPNAPPLLCWRGAALGDGSGGAGRLPCRGPAVSIVGTRRSTRYGLEVASRLGRDLTAGGVSVVSGLALGIDAAAHQGALSVAAVQAVDGLPSAIPIAVVASGVDHLHPRRNRAIWEGVAERGLIVSEYPLGTPPAPWRFPERNRVVVAMSAAVVVVESHERGGSLITAGLAGDAGVPVLAVPGAVTSPSSLGTNRLLVDGCSPCLAASDVFDVLGLHTMSAVVAPPLDFGAPAGLDAEAAQVWDAVPWDGADASALVEATSLGFGAVSMALVRLQERRLVESQNGVFYRAR